MIQFIDVIKGLLEDSKHNVKEKTVTRFIAENLIHSDFNSESDNDCKYESVVDEI